jgi:hypothetical protein
MTILTRPELPGIFSILDREVSGLGQNRLAYRHLVDFFIFGASLREDIMIRTLKRVLWACKKALSSSLVPSR